VKAGFETRQVNINNTMVKMNSLMKYDVNQSVNSDSDVSEPKSEDTSNQEDEFNVMYHINQEKEDESKANLETPDKQYNLNPSETYDKIQIIQSRHDERTTFD